MTPLAPATSVRYGDRLVDTFTWLFPGTNILRGFCKVVMVIDPRYGYRRPRPFPAYCRPRKTYVTIPYQVGLVTDIVTA